MFSLIFPYQKLQKLCHSLTPHVHKGYIVVILKTGAELISFLYCNGSQTPSLTDLRYRQMIERMAPTERAAQFHALRVHHQVSAWLNLCPVLPFTDYGFTKNCNIVSPVVTDKASAPDDLLRDIRCSCKSSTPLCKSCTCCKYHIPCSIHCHCGGQCENSSQTEQQQ